MCQVIDDLRIIDERLTRYNNEREQLESSKTNESEYRRRKLIYFADLNRKAQNDIVNFLNYGIKDYYKAQILTLYRCSSLIKMIYIVDVAICFH